MAEAALRVLVALLTLHAAADCVHDVQAAEPVRLTSSRGSRANSLPGGFGHSPVPDAAPNTAPAAGSQAQHRTLRRYSDRQIQPVRSTELDFDWSQSTLTAPESPDGTAPENSEPRTVRHRRTRPLPQDARLQTFPPADVQHLPRLPAGGECSDCDTRRLRRLFDGPAGNFLDRTGIHLDGWIEQGLTFNFESPQNDSNQPGAGFNDAANEYLLNQLYFRVQKEPPTDRDVPGLGFQTDLLFGSDARFVTADGLDDSWAADHRYYRIALPQAFLDVYVPTGPGIRVRVGRYYAVSDFETVPAPENFFYSHTYSMQYGQPRTLTGTLSSCRITPSIDLNFGVNRGWDDFSDDDEGGAGLLAAVTWRNSSERFRLAAVSIATDEPQELYSTESGVRVAQNGSRFLQTVVATARLTRRWSAVWQATYGRQEDAAVSISSTSLPITPVSLQDAQWYGLSQYVFYDLSPRLSLGGRLEWFRDDDGTRVPDGQWLPTGGLQTVGTVQSAANAGAFRSGGNYTGLTFGCNWRPACGLTVRPELRFDWSDVTRHVPAGPGGVYHDRTDSTQVTLGTDVIWMF